MAAGEQATCYMTLTEMHVRTQHTALRAFLQFLPSALTQACSYADIPTPNNLYS